MTTNARNQQKPVDDAFIAEHDKAVLELVQNILAAAMHKTATGSHYVVVNYYGQVNHLDVYADTADDEQYNDATYQPGSALKRTSLPLLPYFGAEQPDRTDYALIQQELHDLLQQILEL